MAPTLPLRADFFSQSVVLVSACLIVKNEERFLPGCLRSLAGLTDEIVVVDTGSSDATMAIARAHGAVLVERPWDDDFSAARNAGLERAQGRFVLYLDADEELVAEDRAPLREAIASDAWDAFNLSVVSAIGGSDKTNVVRYLRVFRRYPDARFRYRIHEQIWPSLAPHRPRVCDAPWRILHHGYDQPEEVLVEKRRRNLALALRELERSPDDAFYLYHAGLGHLTLGEARAAIPWLERAERHSDTSEMRALALDALGQAHYDLGDAARAERALSASTELVPEQTHGWAVLADLFLLNNRHAEAIPALQACLQVKHSRLMSDVSPPRAILTMKLGLSQLLTRDAAAARASLTEALALGLPEGERATAEKYLAMATRLGV